MRYLVFRIVRAACSAPFVVGLCFVLSSTGVAADPAQVTLQGVIATAAGAPVSGAFVHIGATVRANAAGRYAVPVQPQRATQATVWSPGFNPESIALHVPPSAAGGDVMFDFRGLLGLTDAFHNPQYGAVLKGLPTLIPTSKPAIRIHGRAGIPLETAVFVTQPNGSVTTYPLHVHGSRFSATLPFQANGDFTVEINAVSGFAVFNVLVFRGVTPYLPSDLVPQPDPGNAGTSQLAGLVLSRFNKARTAQGLAPLQPLSPISGAASRHNRDIVQHHYFFEHPHIGSNGSTPWQRVSAADPRARRVGEDISEAPTVGQAISGILCSPSHRAIVVGDYRWIGVAITRDGDNYLVTVDFVR